MEIPEKYSDEPTQSYRKFPTKDLWINNFLGRTFANCYDGLKPNRFMLINIADTRSFPNMTQETIRVAEARGFQYLRQGALLLSLLHAHGFKREPLLLFQKPAR